VGNNIYKLISEITNIFSSAARRNGSSTRGGMLILTCSSLGVLLHCAPPKLSFINKLNLAKFSSNNVAQNVNT